MELRVLEYFLQVIEAGNITKAAEALHITQPTLSRQLQQLEADLGVVLFIRGKYAIELTEPGFLLKRRAEELLELAEKTKADFAVDTMLLNGEIAIGCAECEGMQFLANAMQVFHAEHPDATYDLYNGNADQVEERLEHGLLDLALVLEPINLDKYEYLRLEGIERWGLVLPITSELATKEHITAADLAEQSIPLIKSKRKNMQREVNNWLGAHATKVSYLGASNLIGNASILVQKGMGYAFVIEGAITNYQHPSLIFRPLYPELATRAVLIWKKQQKQSATVATFLSHLRSR